MGERYAITLTTAILVPSKSRMALEIVEQMGRKLLYDG